MKLKKKIATLDNVPEQYHGLYQEAEGGGFALIVSIEGDGEPSGKVDEFRRNNIELRKELERFEGIDPDNVRKLQAQVTEGEEKQLLDAGKIDELVERRVARAREDYERELAAKKKAIEEATGQVGSLTDRLSGFMIDEAVNRSVAEIARVRPGAESDLRARARAIFRVDPSTGGLMPDASGKVEYGKSGDPLTLKEWSQGLVDKAPHLFEAPKGAGAGDSDIPAGVKRGKIPTDPVEFGKNAEAIAKGELQG